MIKRHITPRVKLSATTIPEEPNTESLDNLDFDTVVSELELVVPAKVAEEVADFVKEVLVEFVRKATSVLVAEIVEVSDGSVDVTATVKELEVLVIGLCFTVVFVVGALVVKIEEVVVLVTEVAEVRILVVDRGV